MAQRQNNATCVSTKQWESIVMFLVPQNTFYCFSCGPLFVSAMNTQRFVKDEAK